MYVVLLLTTYQVLDRPMRKLSLLGILARRRASKRLKNQDAQLCSFVACRLWHRKLEEEAGGMVDAILRDTEHQVFIAWLHATYSDLVFPPQRGSVCLFPGSHRTDDPVQSESGWCVFYSTE